MTLKLYSGIQRRDIVLHRTHWTVRLACTRMARHKPSLNWHVSDAFVDGRVVGIKGSTGLLTKGDS